MADKRNATLLLGNSPEVLKSIVSGLPEEWIEYGYTRMLYTPLSVFEWDQGKLNACACEYHINVLREG